MFWPNPTHQPTQPPTHPPNPTPTHGGEFFTDFKSLNRIEISWLDQVLLNFNWFRWSPWGVANGWMRVGLCQGIWGAVPHRCICAWAHTHVHVHEWWCHNGNFLGKPITWEQPFAWNYHVYTCMHMRMCIGHPPKHPDRVPPISTHSHPPKGGTPEIIQKSIKIEWIEIFAFCLKILDLWTLLHSYRLHLVCRWGVSYHK